MSQYLRFIERKHLIVLKGNTKNALKLILINLKYLVEFLGKVLKETPLHLYHIWTVARNDLISLAVFRSYFSSKFKITILLHFP